MKKIKFPQWVFYSTSVLVLITIALIVNSCRKEARLTPQEINLAKAAEQFPVNAAMSWFNTNKTNLANKVKKLMLMPRF
jgi:hypothetical protein